MCNERQYNWKGNITKNRGFKKNDIDTIPTAIINFFPYTHTLIEGILHASFHCENINTGEKNTIDARTSDAIAIAIRCKCPIFTYEDILERAGIIINAGKTQIINISIKKEKTKNPKESNIKSFSVSKLKKLLEQAIEKEDYETASKIRDEINSRENK